MAGEEQDLEVAPLTAEELALRCLEVEAVARGEALEMHETQETESPEGPEAVSYTHLTLPTKA